MKKTTARILLVFMILTMVVSPLFSLSWADELWKEDYYRASSSTGGLSEEQRADLDSQYIEFMEANGVDFAAIAITSDRLDDSIEDFAEDYFDDCHFGYGDHEIGFMVVYLQDKGEVRIVPINGAEKFIDSAYLELAESDSPTYYDKYGEWGVMYAGFKHVKGEVEKYKSGEATAVPALGEESAAVATDPVTTDSSLPVSTDANNSMLPYWYPEDLSSFQFFHNDNAPRVVDNAELLSDEEEAQLESMIAYVAEKTAHDLVIVTDVTDYGLGQMEFADDYYDFNGYGCGDDREGALLFIDMDPMDRGGWCSCTGPDTMNLYTEDVANDIDDIVYARLGKAEYYKAFSMWVSLMGNLFEKGEPFAPSWMPARGAEVTRTQDASAPRVVDESELLTDAQIAELEGRIDKIREKYGVDVIIFTPGYMSTMTTREYGRALWQYCGYGIGENNNAIIMSIRNARCYANGLGSVYLSDVNQDRIEEKAEEACQGTFAYYAADSFLKDVEHMLKTGRVQKPVGDWIRSVVTGLLGGSVFGGISAGAAQGKMKTPKTARSAEEYLDRDSIQIINQFDHFLGTTTDRVYDPPEERTSSGGGSSGGHSSYSGGHSSHSGSSHSGSGRKF